jgi:hypothetical protein
MSKVNNLLSWLSHQYSNLQSWDWRAIIVCATLSLVLWLFNSLNAEQTTELSFPIVFQYDKEKVFVLNPPPNKITVVVTGVGWNLLKRSINLGVEAEVIKFDNLSALLGATNFATGPLLSQVSSKLKELQVHRVKEDSITFKFDTLATKPVKVLLDTGSLILSDGYRVTSDVTIEPSIVKLTGPSSFLKNYGDTIIVQLNGVKPEGEYRSEIPVKLSRRPFTTIRPEKVSISFATAKFEERTLTVGLTLKNFPDNSNTTVFPGKAKIQYWIEADEEYIPIRDSLQVIIDYKLLNTADSTIEPITITPKYFVDPKVVPPLFKISTEKIL